jgi:hypothetical protein
MTPYLLAPSIATSNPMWLGEKAGQNNGAKKHGVVLFNDGAKGHGAELRDLVSVELTEQHGANGHLAP